MNTRSIKDKNKFSRRILLDQISSKGKVIKSLRAQYNTSINDLLFSTTLFKGYDLKISINPSVLKEDERLPNGIEGKLIVC